MSLSSKQRYFSKAVNYLLTYGYSLGYEFTFGDCYRSKHCSHGHPDSTHRVRLAIDLNLFINGEYISDGNHPAFNQLHDYWDLLGGSERIAKDMNHFSYRHNGIL